MQAQEHVFQKDLSEVSIGKLRSLLSESWPLTRVIPWHLTGGFKYGLFSSLFGEMIQFDEHIFQMIQLKPPTRHLTPLKMIPDAFKGHPGYRTDILVWEME